MSTSQSTVHHSRRSGHVRRKTRRSATVVLSVVLSAGLLAAPALADDGSAGRGPEGFPAPAPAVQTTEQRAVGEAVARAKKTGQPVVVEALTTETSRTVATPAGRLSTTDSAQPVRARRDGAWADLDPTLRHNPDGTLSPAVSGTTLTLSGGGNGPMAALTTTDGKTLSVTAPFPLPTPTTNGTTATYRDVLPEVDLQVTALPSGGWRNVLVVRTVKAATLPELKTLRFRTTATGLTVSADAAGNIEAKDADGRPRFHAPTPLQWDSSTTPPAPVSSAKGAGAATARAQSTDTGTEGPAASNADTPGPHAVVAAMGTKVIDGAIELTPDQNTLGKGTGPWYLDPTLVATSNSQGSVEVQENHPTAKNYDVYGQLATGHCGYSDCIPKGRQRAYFKIGLNTALRTTPGGAPQPPTLYGSTLNTYVTGASSPGTATPFGFYRADGDINSGTDWGNQPCGANGRMAGCAQIASGSITGTGALNVDVTGAVQQATAQGRATLVIGIAPDDENNMYYRHRFANNPSITTEYDHTPSVWYPRTGPAPYYAKENRSIDCTTGISGSQPWENPGWIGANQNIWLSINSWSPAGFNLHNQFHIWDDTDPTWGATPGAGGGSWNTPASVPVGSLTDGHQYGWNAWAGDGTLTSAATAGCWFRVDRTNPRVSIASPDFPPSGTPNDNPTAFSHTNALFTLSGTDPAPADGLQASGLACFRVSTDPTPVTGWHCGDPGTVTADASGNASFHHTPGNWGTNLVYAQAQDNAGNYSQPAVYSYYAPWQPGSLPVFGDVDGDRKPDILRPDAAGNLTALGANTDPTRTTSATATSAPGNDQDHHPTWNDYLITHRGALINGANTDQIIAHNTTDPELKKLLHLVYNDGAGHFDNLTSTPLNRPTQCRTTLGGVATECSSTGIYDADWSTVTQLVALGTPEGEATTTDGAMTTRTSLLTVERDGRLWLHRPGGANSLNNTAQLIPTTPGTGDWNDYDLINPGPANGLTSGKSQATLWARHRASGSVYAYAITGGATPDYTALTTPDNGYLILVNSGTTAADHPRIGSSGDLDGDGLADLWTIDTTGNLGVWRGLNHTTIADRVDGFTPLSVMGKVGATASVRAAGAPDSCLDIEGGIAAGHRILLWTCHGGDNQHFNLATDGTIRNSGLCLSTQDNALAQGVGLAFQPCAALSGQQWTRPTDGTLRNTTSGLCIDLPGFVTADGTRPVLWACNGGTNQRWNLNPENQA
ncbi:ricin-type beta-trefoil lectin domain protein [Kitasatospora sp. NPDC004240]